MGDQNQSSNQDDNTNTQGMAYGESSYDISLPKADDNTADDSSLVTPKDLDDTSNDTSNNEDENEFTSEINDVEDVPVEEDTQQQNQRDIENDGTISRS